MRAITKNKLEQNISDATSTLLEIARKSCWNDISKKKRFIISEIKNDTQSFKIERIEKNKSNRNKKLLTLENAVAELKLIYENLYDINLHIYKSEKERTIIDIRYYPKSALEIDYYETIKNNDPMLHCKIGIPIYAKDKTKKYDVNWELGGIRHKWNLFWYRIQFKWKYRNRIKNVG